MPAPRRLTSAYADAPYASEHTPEFRFKSVRAPRRFAGGKRTFKHRLMQQQLPAWRPLYEGRPTLIFTFLVGILMLSLGLWMRVEILRLLSAEKGLNCTIPYPTTDRPHKDAPYVYVCEIHIQEDIKGPVMFGYRWNQILQSHSKFSEHRHEGLKGEGCADAEKIFNIFNAPEIRCGAGVNSNFEDTFELCDDKGNVVPMTEQGVIEDKIREFFKHPFDVDDPEAVKNWTEKARSCAPFGQNQYVKSTCWAKKFWELDEANMNNNGRMNTDYIVWQNKAAFPVFRKPYRSLDRNNTLYKDGLPKGIYKLKAKILTTLTDDHGRRYIQKEFLITTSSWLGIRNVWFAWAYIVVGIVCMVLVVGLVLVHLKHGKTLQQKCSDSMPVVFH